MRPSFAKQEAPLIVDVIRERNTRDVIAAIRNGQHDGAMGYDLHLSCLDDAYRTVDEMRAMISSTAKPVLALNYSQTYSYTSYTTSEEERIGLLLMAAEAGVSAVDLQAYSYDVDAKERFQEEFATDEMPFAAARPKEIALNPDSIQQQVALIDRLHALGTEVLMSCHTSVPMNCAQVVSLARVMEKRKPDIIKIVTPCENDEQLLEAFRTMVELKKVITHARIHFHCSGHHGKLTRIINPMLGAYLMFCTDRYTPSSNFEQLHLKTMVDAFRTMDWRMD
ncbi:MAG TPA: type I 3-dehydroquinate dehydratase [Armatimonadota bacterium]|nr:type I 3-dehydroquinate dehydratase [Armatimonadota bacterium]